MKRVLTTKFSVLLLFSGVALLMFGVLIFLWNDFDFSLSNKIQSEKAGQFGDFIGGVIGSVWALPEVIYWSQK